MTENKDATNNTENNIPKSSQKVKTKRRFSRNRRKSSTKTEQKSAEIDQIPFTFPAKLPLAPECIEFSKTYNTDKMDGKIEEYLWAKYKSEISDLPIWYDDIIIRFVTGYRHIAKTENDFNKRLLETDRLFVEYLKWHKNSDMTNAHKIKHINNVPISEYVSGSYIYGQDRYGHPLLWDEGLKVTKTSDLTVHKNCGESGMDTVLAFIIRLLHEMKYATNKYYGLPTKLVSESETELKETEGRSIGIFRHCIIMDLNEFNSKKTLKDRKIHEYYTKKGSLIAPEMIHKVYVINAPKLFQGIWKILKAFLHPNTIEKTQILGKDYMNELLKEIDIHMIPKRFGGKGKWTVTVGGIPKDYPVQMTHLNEH